MRNAALPPSSSRPSHAERQKNAPSSRRAHTSREQLSKGFGKGRKGRRLVLLTSDLEQGGEGKRKRRRYFHSLPSLSVEQRGCSGLGLSIFLFGFRGSGQFRPLVPPGSSTFPVPLVLSTFFAPAPARHGGGCDCKDDSRESSARARSRAKDTAAQRSLEEANERRACRTGRHEQACGMLQNSRRTAANVRASNGGRRDVVVVVVDFYALFRRSFCARRGCRDASTRIWSDCAHARTGGNVPRSERRQGCPRARADGNGKDARVHPTSDVPAAR